MVPPTPSQTPPLNTATPTGVTQGSRRSSQVDLQGLQSVQGTATGVGAASGQTLTQHNLTSFIQGDSLFSLLSISNTDST